MKWTVVYFASFLGALASPTAAQSSLLAQIGQHVIFSYPGATPPDELLSLITAGKVGGVILFGENVNSLLPGYIDEWQSTYAASAYYSGSPLLIMTDQEGGQVRRLPGGPVSSEKTIGASANPSTAAATAGNDAATSLVNYHMNVNLAPVLDVYYTAGDLMDQYGRSYSNDPTIVGECATSFITSQQAGSVQATAKHFPGLGAAGANENTDEVPVTINTALSKIRSVDEAPYVQAIKAGVTYVMTSWAVYPALDTKPAGLSSKWVDELRTRLGFTGPIITDAIEAGALVDYGTDANRAVLALQAGVDIILAAARNITQGESIVSAISTALNDGTLSQSAFTTSTARIRAARQKV